MPAELNAFALVRIDAAPIRPSPLGAAGLTDRTVRTSVLRPRAAPARARCNPRRWQLRFLRKGANQMKRILWAVATVVGLFLIGVFFAKILAGNLSTTTLVEIARSQCVKDGFPAADMMVSEVTIDNGLFGFDGHGTVEFRSDTSFGRDGKPKMAPLVLRVELRRRMDMSGWEVTGISHEP
jgi:hypothetical protein